MHEFKALDLKNRNYEQVFIFVQRYTDLDSLCSAIAMANYFELVTPSTKINIVGWKQTSKLVDTSNLWFKDSDEKEAEYIQGYELTKVKKTLAVLVDIPNEISVHNIKLLNLCSEIIIIDHHNHDENQEPWSKEIESKTIIKIINPLYASCSELIWDLFGEISPESRTIEVAEKLFMGLYSDNQGFLSSETNARTFQIISEMIQTGINVSGLIRNLKSRPIEYGKLFGKLMAEAQIYKGLLFMNLTPGIVYETVPFWISKKKNKDKSKIRQTKLFTFPINMARELVNVSTTIFVHYSLFDPWNLDKKMVFIVLDKPTEALEQVLRANKFKKNRNRWIRVWRSNEVEQFVSKYLDLLSA